MKRDYSPSKEEKEELKKAQKNSKSLYDLVVSEKFIVNEVISESYKTSIQTRRPALGGSGSVYKKGGYTSKLILKVESLSQKVPVKTLEFSGFSIVKKGDYILAKIPRYKEKTIDIFSGTSDETFYYSRRAFKKQESAIEINILSKEKNNNLAKAAGGSDIKENVQDYILRTDRAVNYGVFVKKSKRNQNDDDDEDDDDE